jgi:hypothetical protein
MRQGGEWLIVLLNTTMALIDTCTFIGRSKLHGPRHNGTDWPAHTARPNQIRQNITFTCPSLALEAPPERGQNVKGPYSNSRTQPSPRPRIDTKRKKKKETEVLLMAWKGGDWLIALLKSEHGLYTLEIRLLLKVDPNFTSLDTAAPTAPAHAAGSKKNLAGHNLQASFAGTRGTTRTGTKPERTLFEL